MGQPSLEEMANGVVMSDLEGNDQRPVRLFLSDLLGGVDPAAFEIVAA